MLHRYIYSLYLFICTNTQLILLTYVVHYQISSVYCVVVSSYNLLIFVLYFSNVQIPTLFHETPSSDV